MKSMGVTETDEQACSATILFSLLLYVATASLFMWWNKGQMTIVLMICGRARDKTWMWMSCNTRVRPWTDVILFLKKIIIHNVTFLSYLGQPLLVSTGNHWKQYNRLNPTWDLKVEDFLETTPRKTWDGLWKKESFWSCPSLLDHPKKLLETTLT